MTLIGVAQLVCLLLGEGWFVRRLAQTLHEQLNGQALAETRAAVTQSAARLARGRDAGKPGSGPVAEFVRRAVAPAGQGARMLAVDARSGALIADSGRAGSLPGDARCESIVLADGRKFSIERLAAEHWTEAQGLMRTSDGLQWVTARLVPELDVFVVAQKPVAGIARTISGLISAIDKAGVLVALFVSILSFLMVAAIVQAYQHRLESVHDDLEHRLSERGRQLTATRDAVVYGLAKLAESRDDDTGEHLDRIRDYVRPLARELAATHPELDDRAIQLLCVTSSLHDIGKVGIPDAVLLKPGRLTAQERAIIQKHPTIGGDCLMALRERLGEDDHFLDMACEIAFAHHERWDGQGYPFGLAGEEIPLSARIVAVADVYDALTTRRVYKSAESHAAAAAIILEGAGTQFDPQVVRAFERCQDQFRLGAQRAQSWIKAPSDPSSLPGQEDGADRCAGAALARSMQTAEDRA